MRQIVAVMLGVAFWLALMSAPVRAEMFEEHFNSPKSGWRLIKPRDRVIREVVQRRSPDFGKEGVGELVRVEVNRGEQELRLEFDLPKAQVLNELEAMLWVRSPVPGAELQLRIVLPEYEDPATGQTLEMLIPGDVYQDAGEWERLTCRTTDELVQKRLQWLRARLSKQQVSPRTMLVDRLILKWPVARGINEVSLDELSFGPIVQSDDRETDLELAAASEEAAEDPPVHFRLDQFQIDGRAFFPLIVKHHQEPLKELAALGFNVVWVKDYADQAILNSLRREGMWAAATPPIPRDPSGEILTASDAGLSPFSEKTRPIAFWMLGTRLTPDSQTHLSSWIDQIQKADGKFRRPLAADVTGDESFFSRELQLLGISRHVIGSTFRISDYRDWLTARRLQARPGSLCWTWIQVTPSRELSKIYEQHDVPDQIEPEQIRAQVYAALTAGVRGLGFWTTRPLSEAIPGDRETMLALKQINLEVRLLEPWLATTNAVNQIPVSIELDKTPTAPRRRNTSASAIDQVQTDRDTKNRARIAQLEMAHKLERELSASVLQTDSYGKLILLTWHDEHGQYVPGRFGDHKLSLIVPGDETAQAVEITTTGLHSLDRKRVSGGIKLTLKQFDQTACILLTSDRELINQTRQRIAGIQEESARTIFEAAELKLERVRAVDQQLSDLGLRQPDAPLLLGNARSLLTDDARKAVSQQNWPVVHQCSWKAQGLARMLQRDHWDSAVRGLPSPVSSPLTVSFQTLPAQAQLALRLAGKSTVESSNQLPAGDFEDLHTVLAVWRHEQDEQNGVKAQALIDPNGRQSKQSLRMYAMPHGHDKPLAVGDREYVRAITPNVTVHAGQILRVGGWVRIPAEIQATQDGLMIYDSIAGRSLALRYRETCNWQRFEFIREATESKDVTVTLALTGLGEVYLDDLEISVLTPASIVETTGQNSSTRPRPAASNKRWDQLRRLNPLSGRTVETDDSKD